MAGFKRISAAQAAPELVTLKAACARLGVHLNTGYAWRDAGTFPVEILVMGGPVRGRYYCRVADLDALAESHPAAS
jgi:hypothetical protein